MSREQSLVNSQISVNRAVFAMNMKTGDNPHGARCDDGYITECIDAAIAELYAAKAGYEKQADMFNVEGK